MTILTKVSRVTYSPGDPGSPYDPGHPAIPAKCVTSEDPTPVKHELQYIRVCCSAGKCSFLGCIYVPLGNY